jgi:hypothetical protein
MANIQVNRSNQPRLGTTKANSLSRVKRPTKGSLGDILPSRVGSIRKDSRATTSNRQQCPNSTWH